MSLSGGCHLPSSGVELASSLLIKSRPSTGGSAPQWLLVRSQILDLEGLETRPKMGSRELYFLIRSRFKLALSTVVLRSGHLAIPVELSHHRFIRSPTEESLPTDQSKSTGLSHFLVVTDIFTRKTWKLRNRDATQTRPGQTIRY